MDVLLVQKTLFVKYFMLYFWTDAIIVIHLVNLSSEYALGL